MVAMVLAWIGVLCWPVCFWWMHRISKRQDSTLLELRDVIKRIEELTKEESDLIREVHPAVENIEESVEEVADKVKETNGREKAPA